MTVFFSEQRVTNRVTAIRTLTGELLYLVEGATRAALIDSSLGIRGLRAFVERLTKKPIVTILTHGHVDHAMGGPEFDNVYMNSLDVPVYDEMAALKVRREFIDLSLGDASPRMNDSDFVPPHPLNFEDLTDGQIFDLGGICVEALHFPGHTPGMTAILIPEERILITGDACNQRTFLWDHNSTSVEEYRDSVLSMKERTADSYDRLFISHMTMDMPLSLFDEAIELCDQVLNEDVDDVPFEFMGSSALIAKRFDESQARLDGKSFNLVYSKDRMWRQQIK